MTVFFFFYDFVFTTLLKMVIFCMKFSSLEEENDGKNTLLTAVLIRKKEKWLGVCFK